ncbi:hypothetical protein BGZ70_008128 [Mortierella alpina]|uniref:F-box domain-containing protein n=1 Tax=Mortierella alpina TaxID=64518 RepID=A0A9P6J473_MORAP|nr:hypothetical protein BGZ70_008128 [Mortierella alpina]
MNSTKSVSAAIKRPAPYARPGSSKQPGASSAPKLPIPVQRLGSATPAVNKEVPVNDLVQYARQSFSQKDFVASLGFLSRALAIAPKDINLLDSRAACLEKLGRTEEALADAKTMIRAYPQNPKGYLRAGKVLRIQQNITSSAKIYLAGAERCEKGSSDYEILARIAGEMAIKLEERAKKEARVLVLDPMERLPFELIIAIFDTLTFTERVRCMSISKKWMGYLGSVRHYWYSIELSKRSPSLIKTPVYSQYMPVQPDHDANNKITNKTVLGLVKHTPPKELHLGCAEQLTGGLLAQLAKLKRVGSLQTFSLRLNSRIPEQEFSLFWSTTPKLRSLDVHGCVGITDTAVVAVLERCPLLEELDISECRVTEACVMINSSIPLPNMRKLAIGRWESPFAKDGIDALVSRFPNLTMLDLRTMRPRGIEALENINQLSQLKHLFTDSIETSMTPAVLHRWVEGIPNLESLQLNACKGVSDHTLWMIAANTTGTPESPRRGWSHSLRMLDLSCSPYLTDQGLIICRSFSLPKLHTLLLNKCSRVTESGLRQVITSSGGELCRLECAGYSSVSDKLLMDITDHCPKIAMLHLANSGLVTGIGLMAVVNQRGQGLERICVDDCPNMGVDAVDRARVVLGDRSRVQYRFHRSYR